VLRRRPEAYHEKVRRLDATAAAPDDAVAGAGGRDDGETPASIHDIVVMKQAGLSAHLRYDAVERRSGLLRFLEPDVTADEAAVGVDDLGDFAGGAWTVRELAAGGATLVRDGLVRIDDRAIPVRAETTIRIGGAGSRRSDRAHGGDEHGRRALTARVAIEWSTMLLGGATRRGRRPRDRVAHDAASKPRLRTG
jgi:hypothetical protein